MPGIIGTRLMAQDHNIAGVSNALAPKVLPGKGLKQFDFFYAGGREIKKYVYCAQRQNSLVLH